MRNIKLLLEYQGTAYVGWQRQVQPNSIQQVVEEAIGRITGRASRLIGASRTDAGVHAAGQVANFRTESALPPERLREALNAVLPPDIAVLDVEEVPEDFHARFDAVSKRYEYTIRTGPVRPALGRELCWHCRWPLDVDRMRRAAAPLVGTHDFAGFASSGSDRKGSVRTLTRCDVHQAPGRMVLVLEGDGFLYNMVRTIAGTLVDIGRGKLPVERVAEVLAAGDRTRAGRTAPARGLCLVRVDYGGTPPS